MSTKKKDQAPAADEQLAATPGTELVPVENIPTADDYINNAIKDLRKVEGQELIDAQIESLKKQYLELKVTDLNDRPAYIAAADGAKIVKKLRTGVENKRKELNEFPLRFQREVNAEAKRITEALTPIETHLKEQVEKFEQAEEAAKRAEQDRRHKELLANGWAYNGTFYVCGPITMTIDQVMKLEDKSWEKAIQHGKDEIARKQAEQDRLEQQRKDAEAAAEKIRIEQEQLRNEQEQLRRERLEARAELLEAAGYVKPEGGVAFIHTEFRNLFIGADIVASLSAEEFKATLAGLKQDVATKREQLAAKAQAPTAPAPQATAPAQEPIAPVDTDVDPFGHAAIEAAANQIEDVLNTDLGDVFASPAMRSAEYVDGYEHCREQVLAIFNDGVQRKRAEFIQLITNLKP